MSTIDQGSTPTLILYAGTSSPAGTAYAIVNGAGTPSAGAGSIGTTSVTIGGISYYFYVITLTAGETATLGDLAVIANDGGGGSVAQASYQVVSAAGADPWAVALPGAYAAGEAGYILGHSTGDPWAVPLPGAYAAGEAGYILGHSTGDPWAVPLPGAYAAGEAGYVVGHMAAATASSVLGTPNTVDVGLSLVQAVKLLTAVLCGVSAVSGFVVTYFDTTDTIARVVATLDGAGQRLSVVYDTT